MISTGKNRKVVEEYRTKTEDGEGRYQNILYSIFAMVDDKYRVSRNRQRVLAISIFYISHLNRTLCVLGEDF